MTATFHRLFLIPVAFTLYSCTGDPYHQSIEDWHQSRIENLKRPDGWLSLVGRDWLKQGVNTFPGFGTITVDSSTFSVDFEEGLVVSLLSPGGELEGIKADQTKIRIGTKTHMIIRRGNDLALRTWDSESPVLKSFEGIDRYPTNETWKITARWEPLAAPEKIVIPTQLETYNPEAEIRGRAVFTFEGKTYSVLPTVEDSGRAYFLVFGDETNGPETYGGGRFLYMDPPENGQMVLDFNKSYNPPCAFTAYATCPVPMPENKLPFRVEAGEKKPTGH
ncbi:MAG: DUF1684 domain-containing protein [Bacteroidetes bacterium]|nr:DUF1684 domain-containing protein [Bacteroidota bacterium]